MYTKSKKILVLSIAIIIIMIFLGGKLFLDRAYVPVILMYHSVDEASRAGLDGYGGKLNLLPRAFARQMKFLHDHRYNVIPLEEFIERIKKNEKIPRKTIAITFDDGLGNNFFYAYPALRKYNFPATIFVITDSIGKKSFLSWSDIEKMQQDNVSIGSHTLSHSWLPSLNDKDIRKELLYSKELLEKMTGRPVKTLSYPRGAFNEKVKAIAKDVGYIGAVATNTGKKGATDDPYALKRIRISMTSDNLFVFWIETSGYYTFIKERRDEE